MTVSSLSKIILGVKNIVVEKVEIEEFLVDESGESERDLSDETQSAAPA